MMRGFASSLLCLLIVALYGSRRFRSRQNETEFPMVSQNAGNLLGWTLTGRRALDRVPNFGALRRAQHGTNIEDHYELAFIRETLAPVARWVSIQGRSRTASRNAGESAHQNILATAEGIFGRRRQEHKETSHRGAQWRTAFAAAAQT
jgi:hypothetical protein